MMSSVLKCFLVEYTEVRTEQRGVNNALTRMISRSYGSCILDLQQFLNGG